MFSSPFTLTEFIWPPGLGPSTGLWRSQKFNDSRDPYTNNNLIDYYVNFVTYYIVTRPAF